MGISSPDAYFSSSSSPSSSSTLSDGRRKRHRRRHRHRSKRREKKRHKSNKNGNDNDDDDEAAMALPPAPSDWDELRSHFRFVLPEDDDGDGGDGIASNEDSKYGSTWQERMVRSYHAGLYKEYVLADLSRASELGKVGLRWRTEREVARGKGFRCCGSLTCPSFSFGDDDDAREDEDVVAYRAAARRHVGIGVAENGGREPMGVIVPPTASTTAIDDALETYLRSCAGERRKTEEEEEERRRRRESKKRERRRGRHRHGSSSSRRGDDERSEERRRRRSLRERERSERRRLSRLPHGTGLHDYEVDFAYVEGGTRKRELVKVRLCLRCAPSLFAAKANNASAGEEGRKAPAARAREAREAAAQSHAARAAASDDLPGSDVSEGLVSGGVPPESDDERGGRQGERPRRCSRSGRDVADRGARRFASERAKGRIGRRRRSSMGSSSSVGSDGDIGSGSSSAMVPSIARSAQATGLPK